MRSPRPVAPFITRALLLVGLLLLPGCGRGPVVEASSSATPPAAPTSVASSGDAEASPSTTPQQRAEAAVLTQDDVGGPDWEGFPVEALVGVLAGPPEEATDNEACHRSQEASLLEPAPAGHAGSVWTTGDISSLELAASRTFVYSGEEEARAAFAGFRGAATACNGVLWSVGGLEGGSYRGSYRQHISAPALGDESLGIDRVVEDYIIGVKVTTHVVAVRSGDVVQLTFFTTTLGAAYGGARTAEGMADAALARLRGAPAVGPATPATAEAPVALTATQQNAFSKAQAYLDNQPLSQAELVDQLVDAEFSRKDAEIALDNLEAVGEVDWWEMAAAVAAIYHEGGASADGTAHTRETLHDALVGGAGFTSEEADYGVRMTGL